MPARPPPGPEVKVLTRAETFQHIEQMALAFLTDRPAPVLDESDMADLDDIVDGLAAFGRKLSARMDTIPERITDNVEAQEILRRGLDEASSALALEIEGLAALYARRADP